MCNLSFYFTYFKSAFSKFILLCATLELSLAKLLGQAGFKPHNSVRLSNLKLKNIFYTYYYLLSSSNT